MQYLLIAALIIVSAWGGSNWREYLDKYREATESKDVRNETAPVEPVKSQVVLAFNSDSERPSLQPETSYPASVPSLTRSGEPVVLKNILYKCEGHEGEPYFSSSPCGSGGEKVEVVNHAWDQSALMTRPTRAPQSAPLPVSQPARMASNPLNSQECRNAMRSYKFEQGYRFRDAAEAAAKRSEVMRVCGSWPQELN